MIVCDVNKIVHTGYTLRTYGTRSRTQLREKLMKNDTSQHHRIPVLGAPLVKVVAAAAALFEVVAVVVDLADAVVAPRLVTAVDALVVAVVGERG